jgi:hypothetical protein
MKAKKGPSNYMQSLENFSKGIVILLFLYWNIMEGAVFQNEYPKVFVKLYSMAAWRLLLLAALIAGALWDPFVGVMLAFTTFFYVMDMEVTMNTWR